MELLGGLVIDPQGDEDYQIKQYAKRLSKFASQTRGDNTGLDKDFLSHLINLLTHDEVACLDRQLVLGRTLEHRWAIATRDMVNSVLTTRDQPKLSSAFRWSGQALFDMGVGVGAAQLDLSGELTAQIGSIELERVTPDERAKHLTVIREILTGFMVLDHEVGGKFILREAISNILYFGDFSVSSSSGALVLHVNDGFSDIMQSELEMHVSTFRPGMIQDLKRTAIWNAVPERPRRHLPVIFHPDANVDMLETLKLLNKNNDKIDFSSSFRYAESMAVLATIFENLRAYNLDGAMKCVDRGDDINAIDPSTRNAALHLVAARGWWAALDVLQASDQEIDYTILDEFGRTAAELAEVYAQDDEMAALLRAKQSSCSSSPGSREP